MLTLEMLELVAHQVMFLRVHLKGELVELQDSSCTLVGDAESKQRLDCTCFN